MSVTRHAEQCFNLVSISSSPFSVLPPSRQDFSGNAVHIIHPPFVQEAKRVDLAAVTETCYQCHAEKRGPFLWEHVPVREDCMTCHEAHGSNHVKMLKIKEPFLCQRCHSDTRHPGTLYDQAQLNTDSNRIIGRSCTNCHQTVHGSNHRSGRTYLR